jgi:hypothetical protein
MKDYNYYCLYASPPTDTNLDELGNYAEYVSKVRREVKEICPGCKHIFDQMFELRLKRLCELTDEINTTYDLPSRKNPKERKDGKEKKKL